MSNRLDSWMVGWWVTLEWVSTTPYIGKNSIQQSYGIGQFTPQNTCIWQSAYVIE